MSTGLNRLILGTVQFGLPYGITNTTGAAVASDEVARILGFCRGNKLTHLDTAVAYGDSELVLGAAGVNGFRVDTKIPPLDGLAEKGLSISNLVVRSLERIRLDALDTVYFHHAADVRSPFFSAAYEQLVELKQKGLFRRIGVSIYDPQELESILLRFQPDVVQAPFNIFDNRVVASGWAKRLREIGCVLYARSVFLQGVLLDERGSSAYPAEWLPYLRAYQGWCDRENISMLEASLGYALAQPLISGVVLGVHSLQQLQEIAAVAASCPRSNEVPDFQVPRTLYDPRVWNLK